MKRSARCASVEETLTPRKKKAAAIHAEIAREVTTLLGRVFAERKKTGDLDLEAVEMAFRAALHQVCAAALSQLLQFPEPAACQRTIPCPCGFRRTTANCARGAFSLLWAQWN